MEWCKQLGQGLKQCQTGGDTMLQECRVLSKSVANVRMTKLHVEQILQHLLNDFFIQYFWRCIITLKIHVKK